MTIQSPVKTANRVDIQAVGTARFRNGAYDDGTRDWPAGKGKTILEPTGQEIRNVIERWREATLRGDLETVLSLMTEDALFLRPGHEPMDRKAYAASFTKFVSSGGARIEQEIRETGASPDGQLGWSWSHISIVAPPGGQGQSRAGDVLTVFRKSPAGQWQLHRDANMLG